MQRKRPAGRFVLVALVASVALAACATSGSMASSMGSSMKAPMMAMDPMKAEHAAIDRFSAAAGHLQVRDGMNGLPGPNQPVDFDKGPFVTTGLGACRTETTAEAGFRRVSSIYLNARGLAFYLCSVVDHHASCSPSWTVPSVRL